MGTTTVSEGVCLASGEAAGTVSTVTSDSAGGTSPWVAVARTDVGLDLAVTTGTARVEATACAQSHLQSAVVTVCDMGAVNAGTSSSTVLNGASFVRLVATGAAQLSVMT